MKWRFWRHWGKQELVEAGELARAVHSRWLSEAFASNKPYPRIPVRAVNQGGFNVLLSKPNGRALADRWWQLTFNKIDELDGRTPSTEIDNLPPLDPNDTPFG